MHESVPRCVRCRGEDTLSHNLHTAGRERRVSERKREKERCAWQRPISICALSFLFSGSCFRSPFFLNFFRSFRVLCQRVREHTVRQSSTLAPSWTVCVHRRMALARVEANRNGRQIYHLCCCCCFCCRCRLCALHLECAYHMQL